MSRRTRAPSLPAPADDRLHAVLSTGLNLQQTPGQLPATAPTEIWARDGMQLKLWQYMKKNGEESLKEAWTKAYVKAMDGEKLGSDWKGWKEVPWEYRNSYPTIKQNKKSKREAGLLDKNKMVHVVRIDFLPGNWRLVVALDLAGNKVTAQLDFSMGLLGYKKWSHKMEGSDKSIEFRASTYEEYKTEIPRLMEEVIKHNYQYLEKRSAELEK